MESDNRESEFISELQETIAAGHVAKVKYDEYIASKTRKNTLSTQLNQLATLKEFPTLSTLTLESGNQKVRFTVNDFIFTKDEVDFILRHERDLIQKKMDQLLGGTADDGIVENAEE